MNVGTVPAQPVTWNDGDMPDYATLSREVTDAVTFMLNPPKIKQIQRTASNSPSGTTFAVFWGEPYSDDTNMWDPAQTNRITPQHAGWYKGNMCTTYAPINTGADITGYRDCTLYKNSVPWQDASRRQRASWAQNNYSQVGTVAFMVPMNGTTDYLELGVLNNSGASLVTEVSISNNCRFYMRWVAPL